MSQVGDGVDILGKTNPPGELSELSNQGTPNPQTPAPHGPTGACICPFYRWEEIFQGHQVSKESEKGPQVSKCSENLGGLFCSSVILYNKNLVELPLCAKPCDKVSEKAWRTETESQDV